MYLEQYNIALYYSSSLQSDLYHQSRQGHNGVQTGLQEAGNLYISSPYFAILFTGYL